jgi:BON domain
MFGKSYRTLIEEESVMAYEEQQARRSRVVVETPSARREVTQTESVRNPEGSGMSGAAVGAIVVLAVALVTLLVLFLMSGQPTDNANVATETPPTTIVQQPAAQQPPVIIQQAPPAPQQAPIVIAPSAPSGGSASGSAPSGSADLAAQAEIDKKIADDPTLSTLGVIVSVLNGKATIMGTVESNAVKLQIERLVRDVKGVREIDNQITVSGQE